MVRHLPKWCTALDELVAELGCGLLRVSVLLCVGMLLCVDVVAVHASTLRQ